MTSRAAQVALLVAVWGVAGFLLGTSNSFAETPPSSKEQLQTHVQEALRAKDGEAFMNLFYWKGVRDDVKASTGAFIQEVLTQDVQGVTFKPLPEDFRSEYIVRGVRHRPNLPIDGFIEIQYTPDGQTNAMSFPYGGTGEAFYFTSTIQETIGEPEISSHSLNVAVFGTIAPDPVEFDGYYVYRQGEEEVRESLEPLGGSGNVSRAFWGDHVSYAEVRKTSAHGWIQLIISEDGEVVFESEQVESNQPIVYELR